VLENNGKESADVVTSITVIDGGPGWVVEVVLGGALVTHVSVPAGSLVPLVVQAVPPPDASHELPFMFEITFTDMGTSSSVTFPYTATAPTVRGVLVTPSSEGVMHGVPEKETSIPLTIRNMGNVREFLVPEVSGTTAAVPFNWRFGGTDPVLELELGPYEETVVPLVLTMSKNATKVSDLPLQVGVIDDDGVSHTTEVLLCVERVDGVELVANTTARTVVSGDDVRFDMTVVNDGNAEDSFYLGVQGLPWGWEAVYTDENGGSIQSMILPTAGKMDITLTLHPLMVTQETLDVTAVAWATSGLASFVDLHLEMLLPDMAIEDISSDNDNVVGHSTTVLVWVTNKGRAPATVDITMFTTDPEQDGGPKTVTLAPGESTKVGFSYTPNREENNIEVILDRHNGVYETNEDNNIGNFISNAQPKGAGPIPGFDLALGLLACMIAGIGLGIRSRRDRTL
jgi:uncharacterized membrane protein